MIYQYQIWKHKEDGSLLHLVFAQWTRRVVYPPNSEFYGMKVAFANRALEHRGYIGIEQGVWRGDNLNEYIKAMRAMHTETLQQDSYPDETA